MNNEAAMAAIFTCVDFRILRRDHPAAILAEQLGFAGRAYHFTSLGTLGRLLQANKAAAAREILCGDLEFVGVETVILAKHDDCAWHKARGSADHRSCMEELRNVRRIVLAAFPNKDVRLFWMTLNEASPGGWDFTEVQPAS